MNQIGYRWNEGLFFTIMVAMSHYLICRLFIGLVELSICYISLLVGIVLVLGVNSLISASQYLRGSL